MKFIRILTRDHEKEIEVRINPTYIVSMREALNGDTEILLTSGERYVTRKNIFKIEEEINQARKEQEENEIAY